MANSNFDKISYDSNLYYPRDTRVYLITGTQTSATSVWTGPLPDGYSAYEAGMTIDYFLPYAGSASAATLNLGSAGAKPVYLPDGQTAVTNQFPRYSVIRLTYIVNSALNNGDGCWKVVGGVYKATTTSVGSASSWNAGSTPTLGTAIPADDITAWDAGSTPTLGTAISADDITAWSAGTMFGATVSNNLVTFTDGTAPSLTYSAVSVPNVTDVGSVPSLTYSAKSIPNVTDVGSTPSLTISNTTVATGITMD